MSSSQTISIKIALVGDANVGKTSLLSRYVDSRFDASITLGVAFMEKTISVNKSTNCTMSLWDLGGSFQALLPIVVESAVAVTIPGALLGSFFVSVGVIAITASLEPALILMRATIASLLKGRAEVL